MKGRVSLPMLVVGVVVAAMAARADDTPSGSGSGSALENRAAMPPALREFDRSMTGDMREVESEAGAWLDQNYMTGNWGGWRNRLNTWGIIPSATYVPDILADPIGGEVHKLRYVHDIGIDLVLDFQRMFGWSGSHFHVSMSSRSGNNLSDDIGNAFTVAQSCCQVTTRLVNLAWEQSLLDHRLNIRAGRIATGDDFLTSRLYWLYVNNGFDANPLGVEINVPYFTYPNAAWGGRVRARPLRPLYVAAGVYDSNPAITANSKHGVDFSIHSDDPLLLAFEAGYEPAHHVEGVLPGHYKVGGYYYTGRLRRFGTPPTSNLPQNFQYGSGGYYFLLDQMVWREDGEQGLWPFVTLVVAPNDAISMFPVLFSGGLTYEGLVPGRDQDVSLVGVIYGGYSAALRRSEAGSAAGQQDFETVIEWGYIITVAPWLHVQPDFQYIIRPSGTGSIPDAFVVGAQIAVNL